MEEKKRPEELFQEAEDLLERGKLEEGMDILHRALDEDPHFPPALNKIGVIHAQKQELDKAEKYFQAALENDPDYVPALTNMGNIHQQRDELDRAIELYQRALELDPDYGPAHNNLGAAFKKKGEIKKAVEHLKTARKKGSYAINTDQPLLKNPGCLLMLGLLVLFIVIAFLKYFK